MTALSAMHWGAWQRWIPYSGQRAGLDHSCSSSSSSLMPGCSVFSSQSQEGHEKQCITCMWQAEIIVSNQASQHTLPPSVLSWPTPRDHGTDTGLVLAFRAAFAFSIRSLGSSYLFFLKVWSQLSFCSFTWKKLSNPKNLHQVRSGPSGKEGNTQWQMAEIWMRELSSDTDFLTLYLSM